MHQSFIVLRFSFLYLWLITVAICGPVSPAGAQQPIMTARLDTLAQALIRQQQVAGIQIRIIQRGRLLYNKAFGYADPETGLLLQTDHLFRIASQTKAITSLAALMLLEEGRFLLEDPVAKYLPAFAATRVLDTFRAADSSYTTVAAQHPITIRDLFRHTSGITYPVFSGNEAINAIYAKAGIATGIGSPGRLEEQIRLLATQPLLHQPGTAFTYGLNTDVLGYLVEQWGGMPLDSFLRKRIFEPLEMKDTYFHLPPAKRNRLVPLLLKDSSGQFRKVTTPIYEGNHPDYPNLPDIDASGGAGLVSTTADYARFLQLILNKGWVQGRRLIGEHTLQQLLTDQLTDRISKPEGLGFGLGVALVTPRNQYLHAAGAGSFYWGGIFNTHYWADPDNQLIGLVFTQSYHAYSESLGQLLRNIVYASLQPGQ